MNTQNRTTINPASAILWASAFVIGALVIMQAGRLQGNIANAEMVADRGSYTLLTASSGRGGEAEPDELLFVIDSREQILLVYEVEDARKRQIHLRDPQNLDLLFQRARQ